MTGVGVLAQPRIVTEVSRVSFHEGRGLLGLPKTTSEAGNPTSQEAAMLLATERGVVGARTADLLAVWPFVMRRGLVFFD